MNRQGCRSTSFLAALAALASACTPPPRPRDIPITPQVSFEESPVATSESGESLVFYAHLESGEHASWRLSPSLGTLGPVPGFDDPAGRTIHYTPPASLPRRDAPTRVTLTVTTEDGLGTTEIDLYPDPCDAGGRWTMSDSIGDPPGGCGFAVLYEAFGDLTPPAHLLLGGTFELGTAIETFDVASCAYTVTVPGEGLRLSSCPDVPYAGVTTSLTFSPGSRTASGRQRYAYQTSTGACCEALVDVTWVRW